MEQPPPPSAPAATPARLWSLDALRGLCALVVFLSHWHLWSTFPPDGTAGAAVHGALTFIHDQFALVTWPTGGHHPAVLAFFVLSGFCIHYPFERRALSGGPAPDWRDYFRRRFLRIAPVYWTASALGLVFAIAEAVRPSGSLLLQLHASGDLEDFIVRFTGIAAVYPKEIFAGNYILITVTVEIAMYVVYPMFYHFAQRGKWRELGVAFLALHLGSLLLLPHVTPFWVFNSVFMLGIIWYAGALAAHLFLHGRARVPGVAVLAAWAVFLALKNDHVPYFYGLNLLKQAAWTVVCALGVLWCLRGELSHPGTGRHPLVAALRWCGDISYSLYAMHTPAIMLATWALLRLGHVDYLAQLAATMTASAVVVLAVHYGIERVFYQSRTSRPDVAASLSQTASRPAQS